MRKVFEDVISLIKIYAAMFFFTFKKQQIYKET